MSRPSAAASAAGSTGLCSTRIAVDIVHTEGGYHAVRRRDARIGTVGEPYCAVRLQVDGTSVLTHPERRVELTAGTFALSRLDAPYNWEFEGEATTAVFNFPMSALGPNAPGIPEQSGMLITENDPLGAHLSPFVCSIVRHPDLLRGPGGVEVARHLAGLLTAGLAFQPMRLDADPAIPPIYDQILDYIRSNIADPDLDLTRIASANYVSKRHLQALFHEHSTTLSAWLRQKRLTEIRKDLGDPSLRGLSIGEIGVKWGLIDQAYLSRVFRSAYGEAPSQWRRRAVEFTEVAVKATA